MIAAAVGSVVAAAAAHAADTILLLKSRESPQYNEAVDGLMDEWKKQPTAWDIQRRTLTEAGVADAPLDAVVVAVGTEAAQWAVEHTTGTVVFCMVANARQNLLAPLSDQDRARVTGVTLNVPAQTQFEALHELLPDAKRVGIIYDPKKSARSVEEARAAAAALGLEVVTREVTGEAALTEATAWIAGRVDVLWATVDSTVFNSRSAQFVLAEMLKRKIPVMGFSENMVKAGALLAPRVSYAGVGRQTAALLAAVLAGDRPAEPVQTPQALDIVVNAHVLKTLNQSVRASVGPKVSLIDE